MKKVKLRKYFLFFYHLLILFLGWFFTLRYLENISAALNITELGIEGLPAILLPRSIAILQTIIFIAATVDTFTNVNFWWSKRFSDVKTKSGEFFAWMSTLKNGSKKELIFEVWQSKIYSVFLLVNTFMLALIFSFIFAPTNFSSIFYISIGLISLCIIALCISVRIFLKWMEEPMINSKVVTE